MKSIASWICVYGENESGRRGILSPPFRLLNAYDDERGGIWARSVVLIVHNKTKGGDDTQ